MNETRYMISDASKMVDVESHVLRYWEEELALDIPRNELGHRYYRERDIHTFRTIRILKDQGFQLRAIKLLLPEIDHDAIMDADYIKQLKRDWIENLSQNGPLSSSGSQSQLIAFPSSNTHNSVPASATANDSSLKLEQFRSILKDLIGQTIQQNSKQVSHDISLHITKELNYLYQNQEQLQEERFRHFDESLRQLQQVRQEVAVSEESVKKRRRFFRKKVCEANPCK